jgi:protein-disulfide isomerase
VHRYVATAGLLGLGLALGLASVSGGCGKKSSAKPDEEELDKPGEKFDSTEPPPDKRKPVEGADLSALSDAEKNRFERLVDKLASPCGKAHSLRTSRNTDPSCQRARFAVTYVIELLKDGATNKDVRELYDDRYRSDKTRKVRTLQIKDAPCVGPSDAQVVLVEFFDYGCPACISFKPVLEEALGNFPHDVTLCYKMFPLTDKHPNSGTAAQAAVAAWQQGADLSERIKNFKAMHGRLFDDIAKHTRSDLFEHAKAIGLNMAKFGKDYEAAVPRVEADKNEGIAAEVTSTPTLFINGIPYVGPQRSKYVKLFIDEALAIGK